MQFSKEEIQERIDLKIKDGVKKYGKDFKYIVLEIIGLEKLLQPEVVEQKEEKLITLVQWNDYHPDPSIPALRMLVFRKDENGFDDVIERRGKRILINETKYFEWRKTHQGC